MHFWYRKEPLILLVGDFFFFLLSLWLALFLRNWENPTDKLFSLHLVPFTFLFIVWIVVFYIAGLYEKQTVILKSRLPNILGNTLLVNSIIAITFFYFVPFFGIKPKTILFIYLAVSFVIILIWRTYGYGLLAGGKKKQPHIICFWGERKEDFLMGN